MDRLREFLKKNPIAGWALVIGLVAIIGYLLAGRLFGGGQAPPVVVTPSPAGVTTPPPQRSPAAQPAPGAPRPAPVAQPVLPVPASPVPAGPVGRADPFIPLVRAPVSGGAAPARPVPPPPPSVSLPPPPFPTPSAPPLPAPPLPGGTVPAPGVPAAPASPSAGITVTGIVGDVNAVAIVIVGGKTEILSEGDVLGDLRVLSIDPVRRLVTFSRAGKRFNVRMGGE